MITTEGKAFIKAYMAGVHADFAQAIGFGIGSTNPVLTDTTLDFETDRADIKLVSVNYVDNLLVFKADIPSNLVGKIYEVGVYSLSDGGEASFSRLLSTFDSGTEGWLTGGSPANFGTTTRVGTDALLHTSSASTSTTSSLGDLTLDLSEYSGMDKFNFAFNVGNGNTSNVQFRFLTDASNYYTFSLGAQSSGYKTPKVLKSAATVTGTPSWGNITQIDVITTSGSGGASSVSYDGIRIEDLDVNNPASILLAREVLPSEYTRDSAKSQEIEFGIPFNIT